ncbi:MAG: CaiB/BaiF CoA-transferase family protein [Chloroflexi bacterium]|nr:CaiB/BaiF CoA-transferase family protein [Chloroflexota bacterium]MDA1003418.1 CaiB/BaiF CoA-transferase family protein [Chloroflexota bacterium]
MVGPLHGIRIIEFAGIGPGPFCGMMLSDMGADIVRVDRTDRARGGDPAKPPGDLLARGRRSIAIDLKQPEGVALAWRLIEGADALFEGFRPGVMERFGLGPDESLQRNPKLVYGRMTGWGQSGPYAQMAGHDINYIALAGALAPIGRKGERPTPPLNLVGDFGGGGMLLALGMVAALLEAARSGKGQVVDAAMVDGASALITSLHSSFASGGWSDERGTNMLDSGAHYYDAYETKDGKYISLGSIEPQFYAEMLRLLGIAPDDLPPQQDRAHWPALKEKVEAVVRTKTRAEWEAVMEGSDVCFAPVLQPTEAADHPHAKARKAFVEIAGVVQPAPAPRFSRTQSEVQSPPSHAGQHTDAILAELGLGAAEVKVLRAAGTVAS